MRAEPISVKFLTNVMKKHDTHTRGIQLRFIKNNIVFNYFLIYLMFKANIWHFYTENL